MRQHQKSKQREKKKKKKKEKNAKCVSIIYSVNECDS